MTSAIVMGAGALGSIYGAALADAGCDVTLLARPAHTEAITAGGLRLRRPDGTERQVAIDATSDPSALPTADVVMVTAKAFDVPGLVAAIPGTPRLLASVQNGVGKDALAIERFGGAVVGCVTMVGGTLVGPGIVHHTLDGTTYLGPLSSTAPGGAGELASLLRAGGLPVDEGHDIVSVSWSKTVLAVAAMGVVALTRFRLHQVMLNPEAAGLLYDLAVESAAVAAAEGVSLLDLPGSLQMRSLVAVDRAEGIAQLRRIGEEMVRNGTTEIRLSILQAIESGRRTEVEAIHGDVLARASRLGLRTPVLETVTAAIRALDAELDLVEPVA